MSEWQLFEPGTVPEYATADWYNDRPHAPHWEESAHRARLMLAVGMVQTAIELGAETISDLGAGDGGLLAQLQTGPNVLAWGYDLQPSNIAAAEQRGASVRLLDALSPAAVYGECVIATEFLEHLVDPHAAVRSFRDRGARWLVASSPYTESDQSHYEFHLWAWDQAGYRALMENAGWIVSTQATVDIFQVLLCEAMV